MVVNFIFSNLDVCIFKSVKFNIDLKIGVIILKVGQKVRHLMNVFARNLENHSIVGRVNTFHCLFRNESTGGKQVSQLFSSVD
jgi:hypothetical protein